MGMKPRQSRRGDPATGERIRVARVAAGLGAAEVAAAIGVSLGFYGNVERGLRLMPIARWTRLVDALPTLTVGDLARGAVEAGTADGGTVEISPSRLPAYLRSVLAAVLVADAQDAAQHQHAA